MGEDKSKMDSGTGNNKCFDFSIDNLLKIETRRRKIPEFSQCSSNTREGLGYSTTRKPKPSINDLNVKPRSTLVSSQDELGVDMDLESQTLSWLNCTRFNPPKLTRSKKRGGVQQERRPGRGPRIPFSPGQITVLENTFDSSRYLSSDSIARLAIALNLSNDRVKIWFQNRRARFKRERAASASVLSPSSPTTTPIITPHNHNHWTNMPPRNSSSSNPFFVGSSSNFTHLATQLCHQFMHA